MPSVSLPLNRMTVSQKMKVIEQVWESLREQEGRVESPAWHGEVLAERARLVATGKAKFSPWKEAKERIRRKVRGSHPT